MSDLREYRQGAVRAYVAAHLEEIVAEGVRVCRGRPAEIELWTALDDMLSIPPVLERDIRTDPSYEAWYVPKYRRVMVKARARVCGVAVPPGRSVDETAKIISGAEKYLTLRMWHERVRGS